MTSYKKLFCFTAASLALTLGACSMDGSSRQATRDYYNTPYNDIRTAGLGVEYYRERMAMEERAPAAIEPAAGDDLFYGGGKK